MIQATSKIVTEKPMHWITPVLIGIIALEHLYFLYLEMFLWTSPKGLKTFGMTAEKAEASKVLAANQGLYNGFLAAGLVWSLLHPDAQFAHQLQWFFLACILVAATYGGYSSSRKILVIQGVPVVLAMAALALL
jgi:putative membrane protein